MKPLDLLRDHVTGAIERGEARPIVGLTADDFTRAADIVRQAERDLGELSDGQRRDLLADNTDLNSDNIRAIVAAMDW